MCEFPQIYVIFVKRVLIDKTVIKILIFIITIIK